MKRVQKRDNPGCKDVAAYGLSGEAIDDDWLADAKLNVGDTKQESVAVDAEEGGGWDVGDEDLELPPELEGAAAQGGGEGYFVPPTKGISQAQNWATNSQIVVGHVLAGSFESAFRLLHDQVGVVEFSHYREIFLSTFARARTSFSPLPSLPSLYSYPHRNWKDAGPKGGQPAIGLKLSDLVQRLEVCYQLTTGRLFTEAIGKFRSLLLNIPLLCVETGQEIIEAQQLLQICREYIIGLKMETNRNKLPKVTLEEKKRHCEMVAYFSHCNLQPNHELCVVRMALARCLTLRNKRTAASFAKRYLQLNPPRQAAQQVREILQECDKNPVDEHQLQYDPHKPFALCAQTFRPIYRGKPEEKCPLCGASYMPQFKDTVCTVCSVAQVGKRTYGLRISPLQFFFYF